MRPPYSFSNDGLDDRAWQLVQQTHDEGYVTVLADLDGRDWERPGVPTIVRNSTKGSPPKRAGVVLAGGQDGGGGTLILDGNVIRGNGGPGILGADLKLHVQAGDNDLGGNEGGPSVGV